MRNRTKETGRAPYLRQWRADKQENHWVLVPRKRAARATIFDIRVRLNLAARAVANA